MARVVRVRYEGGVLKPLEKLDLREGEELTIIIKAKSFYEVVKELQVEAKEDVDKIIWEVRGRGKKLYG
ncbi:MAG: antitoxin family protein [Desulfurococcales archaeon]|nr:antitoxin family protein [Desulfurococcales archaeon]